MIRETGAAWLLFLRAHFASLILIFAPCAGTLAGLSPTAFLLLARSGKIEVWAALAVFVCLAMLMGWVMAVIAVGLTYWERQFCDGRTRALQERHGWMFFGASTTLFALA